jgi:NTP pyrophosphatase (non-canonical NTP hydrolase)
MHIRKMAQDAYDNAQEHGWNDGAEKHVPTQVALICSEAAEALEAYRNKEALCWTDDTGKPQGIGSEFADILIRVGHYAVALGIDLELEVAKKMAYNATRPFRHGGKAC